MIKIRSKSILQINSIIWQEKMRFAKLLARGMDRDQAEELFIRRLKSRLMPQ